MEEKINLKVQQWMKQKASMEKDWKDTEQGLINNYEAKIKSIIEKNEKFRKQLEIQISKAENAKTAIEHKFESKIKDVTIQKMEL